MDRRNLKIYDPTSRLVKIGDALSQLGNVANPFWDHTTTTSNESISGRSHRMGWVRLEQFIDWLFWVSRGEIGHCRNAFWADVRRARNIGEWADG